MIVFNKKELTANFTDVSGKRLKRVQQVRIDPVTQIQCRITPSRSLENERGTEKLHTPPEIDLDKSNCPFCPENLERLTPCLASQVCVEKRLTNHQSILFPNLFPYTEWSAVSLFDDIHHVEIGTATIGSYRDSFTNCSDYLTRVKKVDPQATYMAITQNHLPGAGGSLIHPHLQVHATKQITNNHMLLNRHAKDYRVRYDSCIMSDLLLAEQKAKDRYIGKTGPWEWITAFAPSGFYEIWAIAKSESSLLIPEKTEIWQGLAEGVLNTQRFYRSMNRNAYNLKLLSTEDGDKTPCLQVSLTARSSYAPWVRSDFSGFEIATGEMATFTYPETVAEKARAFWE